MNFEEGEVDTSEDPFTEMKRVASLLGDLRRELIKEGFSEDHAFQLCETALIHEVGGL
ncbi:hypothetical protein SEA_ESPERER_41 [Streptomyces phage Esperer]|uniref:Uncharacterized protein n=10 Tax=Likavirus TaxID=1982880 RepID=A0A411CVH5_9CAUD|nr:hypothetical protein AVT22_gp41 [Streptomyces phage Caliburn]YP_009616541.1 hypothetical protein FDI81_gp43 [Streptomyces phage Hydra]ATE84920.1 hypothetical protein SEA_BEARDEDLADY_42 [Streptomyces phage BeardedLady]ATE85221.1 hypothetical protein SEA_ESPERER_41 [Streptomyces phage Esperer]ATE85445.1 hypothetical protein SEA_OZZIE_41 [Streptomyces phage Ozzie]QAY17244.1 hypothetical protein SEA_BOVELY_41 [Streptomyces phage Bovely]QAY17316.1 hypothetical protein SEA_INDIGO_40 [Streptomyce